MTQSLAFWDIWPRSCAYSGPAASSAAALITVPMVSEIQRIVHPPCDVVIRVVHRREQAQSKPGLAAQTRASGKISGSVSRHQPLASNLCRSSTGVSLLKNASPPLTALVLEAGNSAILCARQLASIA